MAERGGQLGNQNSAKGARWRSAIDRALENRSRAAGIEELDRLAEQFLEQVVAEGISGFRELGDRLDGKPAVTLQGPDGNALVNEVRITLVKP